MSDELIANANSKGLIIDYYGSSDKSYARKADFNLNEALRVIKKDPVIKGAILSLVDRTMETPYQVVGRDKRSRAKTAELKLEDLRFSRVLRKMLFNLFLYGNSFVEIIKKKGTTTDLNVLETTLMDIKAKDNGDIISYEQDVSSGIISWPEDRITHTKLSEITTNVWGDVDIESLYDTLLLKNSIRNWMRWFFETNQSRGLYIIENASSTKVKDFLSLLKANESNLNAPVIVQGKVNYQILRNFSEEGKSLIDVLEWCDTQMLSLLQVPPIVMGFSDQSGRSNSVEQFKAINTRIKNVHEILKDSITYDLFPKMGFNKVKLEFGSLDEQNMKVKVETIKLMKDAGLSNEAISEWMRTQNMFFETKEVFTEESSMDESNNSSSRPKKGTDESNKQLDEISTRDNQLVANASCPELIEPCDQWSEINNE